MKLNWADWFMLAVVVFFVCLALGRFAYEMYLLHRNQSRIDEAYGWLQGYYRQDD